MAFARKMELLKVGVSLDRPLHVSTVFDMGLGFYVVAGVEKAGKGSQLITFGELNELTFDCCDRD